jgi:hypothetical protein
VPGYELSLAGEPEVSLYDGYVLADVLRHKKRTEDFRWFSSGHLQGEHHLQNICSMAEHTAQAKRWLPTRAYEVVKVVQDFPANRTARLSAHGSRAGRAAPAGRAGPRA